jgi:hypothetical protein
MPFSKEETRSLMNMLNSPDEENYTVAFEILKNVNVKKYIGELLVLYKFSKAPKQEWGKQCIKVYSAINKLLKGDEILTGPKTLSLILEQTGSGNSIELFMEFFIKDMTNVLASVGYPIEKFDIDIKLKNNE